MRKKSREEYEIIQPLPSPALDLKELQLKFLKQKTISTHKFKDEDLLEEMIQDVFPGAMSSRLFCVKLNIFLEGQGMCPNCCLFSEGMCCDELNEPELNLMETYWGNRFVYGGLGGYCHGGKTGLAAVLHHIPDLEE